MIEDVIARRRNFYRFLSSLYMKEPEQRLLQDIRNGKFRITGIKEVEEGFKEIVKFVKSFRNPDELYREVADEYVRLFLGIEEAEVLPYQSVFEGKSPYGEVTLRIKRRYMAAGVKKTVGFAEAEDHLGVELGFMAYLCEKQMEALTKGEGSEEHLRNQKGFLVEELLTWVPRFCEQVGREKAGFYNKVARMTEGFLKAEMDAIDELLITVPGR